MTPTRDSRMASRSGFRSLLAIGRWLRRVAFGRRGKVALAALISLAAVTALRIADPWIVVALQERTFDAYQRIQPRAAGDFPVRIVAIDEPSLAEFGQWPWPRTRLAALVKRLSDLGAGVVAFNVIFSEPDRTTPKKLAENLRDLGGADDQTLDLLAHLPDHDEIFSEAMQNARVVLGFAAGGSANARALEPKGGFAFVGANANEFLPRMTGTVSSLPVLEAAAKGVGGISLSVRDRSGTVRRLPMIFTDGRKAWPGLAPEALRVAQGRPGFLVRGTGSNAEADSGRAALQDMRVGDFTLPLTDIGEMWLYFDRDRADRYVSVRDLFDPAREADIRPKIEGHIVFVGSTAAGLTDSQPTPLGQLVPGVSIHAQAAEQILGQDFLTRPDWANGLEILMTVALGALLGILLLAFGAQLSFIVGVTVLTATLAASWLAFAKLRLLIDPVYPALAAIAVYVAIERVLYVVSDREKRFVRQAFGQYLAPSLLAQLEQTPGAMRLGGESRDITVMFMDVRGFTTISESLSAEELVDFINRLLAPLSDAIQAELGTIDKYIGDSIMAFWNAPVEVPDHSRRACLAALGMRRAVQALNETDAFGFAARGWADPVVRIGVGINCGIACVGNMGSERRFNYSAMGDVVNTAARIESSSKHFGMDLLVSADVAARVPNLAMLEAGEVLLKGKALPTKVFALVGDETYAQSTEFLALAARHAQLMASLAAKNSAAMDQLNECRRLAPEWMVGFYLRFEEEMQREHPPSLASAH